MLNFMDSTIGVFRETTKGNLFSYSGRFCDNTFAPIKDYPHIVEVLDGSRFAKVLKTVAYIVIDEDENGFPVVEKWRIRQC